MVLIVCAWLLCISSEHDDIAPNNDITLSALGV